MQQAEKYTTSPVLFMVFNRPDVSSAVFEKIREARPEKLFISADGPRKNKQDDDWKCKQTREIFDRIDWDCKVEKLFHSQNLGCKNSVSTAITWFFEHVEEGIILEDDCLPDPSFFWFCSELLRHYRNNNQVMHISGDNFQKNNLSNGNSYYFSKYTHCWGWASWRRAWSKYDISLTNYNSYFIESQLRKVNPLKSEYTYWKKTFDLFKQNKLDAWGSRWQFSVWYNNGLCILPSVNLVSNIGFGKESTHTTDPGNKLANLKVGKITEINHPDHIEQNQSADLFTFNSIFREKAKQKLINTASSLFHELKKVIRMKSKIFTWK